MINQSMASQLQPNCSPALGKPKPDQGRPSPWIAQPMASSVNGQAGMWPA